VSRDFSFLSYSLLRLLRGTVADLLFWFGRNVWWDSILYRLISLFRLSLRFNNIFHIIVLLIQCFFIWLIIFFILFNALRLLCSRRLLLLGGSWWYDLIYLLNRRRLLLFLLRRLMMNNRLFLRVRRLL
jgi:hypothetical protein